MSDWQERITRDTAPAIWAEHVLRYRLAAPLISSSSVWADLGCGNGIAAAAAFGEQRPDRVILCDLEADAPRRAARELSLGSARELAGDLADPALLETIGGELMAGDGDRVVTCFEVIEHLPTFVPLLEWSSALARGGAATFVISVPNDAFWSIENPYHAARWGDGAFAELRRLLPDEQTLLRQVSLSGSAIARWDGPVEQQSVGVAVDGDDSVASHFIAAFGPRHAELTTGALVVPEAQHERRRWERQRESNLAFAEAKLDAQNRTLSDTLGDLKRMVTERDEWRTYIHELERELGRPLSGAGPEPGQP